MPTRRILVATMAVIAAVGGVPHAEADAAGTASAFVDSLMRNVAEVINTDRPREDKQAALEKLIDASVDVAEVARFCLGRYWRSATPEQQREYVDVFRRVLMNSVAGKIGEYQGVSYTLGRTAPRDDSVDVLTIVNRAGNAPNKVDWIVSMTKGAPKIIDMIAEGVSLRLTQRSDYSAYLERNNNSVQALIDALRRQSSTPQG
jgi:phospholipid transport system substrate-binding protein